MLRFALLYHQCPPAYQRPSHWDLMLEAGNTLRTWALAELPSDWRVAHGATVAACGECPPLAVGSEVEAELLVDHRTAYLDYEGPVSGGRGNVTRVAAGVYDETTVGSSQLEIVVSVGDWTGRIVMSRDPEDESRWRLICRPISAGG